MQSDELFSDRAPARRGYGFAWSTVTQPVQGSKQARPQGHGPPPLRTHPPAGDARRVHRRLARDGHAGVRRPGQHLHRPRLRRDVDDVPCRRHLVLRRRVRGGDRHQRHLRLSRPSPSTPIPCPPTATRPWPQELRARQPPRARVPPRSTSRSAASPTPRPSPTHRHAVHGHLHRDARSHSPAAP